MRDDSGCGITKEKIHHMTTLMATLRCTVAAEMGSSVLKENFEIESFVSHSDTRGPFPRRGISDVF